MNEIASVSGSSGTAVGGARQLNEMKVEDFMKIMIKELRQQDPFEPVSSKDLLQQIGQLRDMQSAMELHDTLEALSSNQKLGAASSMLGKLVVGHSEDGEIVEGMVTSIKREGDKIFLELDSGQRLDLDDVIEVYGKDADLATDDLQG